VLASTRQNYLNGLREGAEEPPMEPTSSDDHDWYAVAVGRIPDVYPDWASASVQVNGYKGAVFKKVKTEAEGKFFIEWHTLQ